MQSLKNLISVEQLDVSDECNSLFDVQDVEKGLNS